MSLTIRNGSLLDVETGYIFQQVNCMGIMNSGLAKAIADKWPVVALQYAQHCRTAKHSLDLLGTINLVRITTELAVVNVFSQYDRGQPDPTHPIKHTEYSAMMSAFKYIVRSDLLHGCNLPHFPYLFGCGLGGGDWKVVATIIEQYFPHATIYNPIKS